MVAVALVEGGVLNQNGRNSPLVTGLKINTRISLTRVCSASLKCASVDVRTLGGGGGAG